MPNPPDPPTVRYTVQIQTCNLDGTKWTAHGDPDNILDPDTPDQVALAFLGAADDHSFLAGAGNDWRVCVWAGFNASPVTTPLYILDADTWRDAALATLNAWAAIQPHQQPDQQPTTDLPAPAGS
jgi:hypothetical protein